MTSETTVNGIAVGDLVLNTVTGEHQKVLGFETDYDGTLNFECTGWPPILDPDICVLVVLPPMDDHEALEVWLAS